VPVRLASSRTASCPADLNGAYIDSSFSVDVKGPFGVATAGGYIYWTNLSGTTIGRASLNGGHTPFLTHTWKWLNRHGAAVHASVGYPPRQTAYSGQSGRPGSGQLIHSRRRCR
jgi:hypothetical protein